MSKRVKEGPLIVLEVLTVRWNRLNINSITDGQKTSELVELRLRS